MNSEQYVSNLESINKCLEKEMLSYEQNRQVFLDDKVICKYLGKGMRIFRIVSNY